MSGPAAAPHAGTAVVAQSTNGMASVGSAEGGPCGTAHDDFGVPPQRDTSPPGEIGRDFGELAARAAIIVLFTFLAVAIGLDFMRTGRLTGLLLLASESLVVVLTVVRRAPASIDRSIAARVLTTLSIVGPPLVRPAALAPLAPELLTVTVSACGLLVVIGGKVSLGRSFGLMPANRGVVSTGLYRFVRHPIYMGYLVTHVAFLAANPTLWNALVLLTADAALLVRAGFEERTLSLDPEYRAYLGHVRWRVVPGVF